MLCTLEVQLLMNDTEYITDSTQASEPFFINFQDLVWRSYMSCRTKKCKLVHLISHFSRGWRFTGECYALHCNKSWDGGGLSIKKKNSTREDQNMPGDLF